MLYELSILVVAHYVALAIHAIGHAVAVRWIGLKLESVSIGAGPELLEYTDRRGTHWTFAVAPIGGACRFETGGPAGAVDCKNEALIYVAGPVSSLMLAVFTYLITWWCCGPPALSDFDLWNSTVSLHLMIGGLSLFTGLINLVPIMPLDGGCLLLCATSKKRVLSGRQTAPQAPPAFDRL